MSIAVLLLPDFALIAVGVALFRARFFADNFWPGLEQLVYFVLFPALLFNATANAQFDFANTSYLMVTGCASVVVGIIFGTVGRLFTNDVVAFASGFQTAFRFNSYIALATAGRLGGSEGIALMAILIGINVPIANMAAVIALARSSRSNILAAMARNPLIIATASGLLINLCGIKFPDFASQVLVRLGSASLALGLITVGAGLRLRGAKSHAPLSAWLLAVKLGLCPATALALAVVLGLSPLHRQLVVAFAAMPTASSAYILATRMGGNGAFVAFLISAGTIVSAVTLPLWLTWAG